MIINLERKPTVSLYYLGSIILQILRNNNNEPIDDLFLLTEELLGEDLHIDFYYYTLDWLYILSLIKLTDGRVSLCV